MAGGGGSDEMNPFISYVDLFASIIMVLLLFVMIMFVNVGYYMQFNSKDRAKSDVNATEEKPKPVEPVVSQIEMKKKDDVKRIVIENPIIQTVTKDLNNTTPVQGGEVNGNTIGKRSDKFAKADFKPEELLISFKNNEYFLDKDVTQQIADFMKQKLQSNPNVNFYLSVGDSSTILSSTQTKQVSLGRVLSLKNALQKMPELSDKVKINYKQDNSIKYQFGYLKIDVR
jgi:hypothetical protein